VSDPNRVAAIMIGFPDAHVLSVAESKAGLWVEVETRDEVVTLPGVRHRVRGRHDAARGA